MAMHQISPQGTKLAALDPIWDRVRNEAEDIVRREPELASFSYSTVLHHERLEASVIHRLAERLFKDTFAIEDSEAHTQACKFEHIISPELDHKICTFLGHPKTCPHGNPIPPGDCCDSSRKT